ncbi:MAG: RNA degradosome polyphosphate kinase [Sporomusaceae bacterium]|nr:RNA degradosome polyphosphate kinase [Sporomusaceae bacterium]
MFESSEYFLNRELSWIKFNERVLQEAGSQNRPQGDRLNFLAITSSNLDEFFMIRVAGLKHQFDSGVHKLDISGRTVEEQLIDIAVEVHGLVNLQYRILKNVLYHLEEEKIFFAAMDKLSDSDKEWCYEYFRSTIYPVITPVAVDASHPFPFLSNRSLNLALQISRKGKDEKKLAVIQVPAVLSRIVEIPPEGGKRRFVFLEKIIEAYCEELFYGYQVEDVIPFRITRNADLFIDEEDAKDLLEEVEKSLRQRKRGQAVRLEIGKGAAPALKDLLVSSLHVLDREVYDINGPLDLTCFFKFIGLPGLEELKLPPISPQLPKDLVGCTDLFARIRESDVLLHHPYESFEPVVQFVQQAAVDPAVLAIKQTLYRVSGNSPIVRALAQAAENGKQVTVLVELKARFDEENNILWAKRLEEAGCHVIYGLRGLKTHAKMILVVRREARGIQRYVHMGTGNYNDSTAKLYTDMGIFTANDQFGADASAFFNVLSGYSDPPVWNKITVAPLGLRQKLVALIDEQIEVAKTGKRSYIAAKMNSLLDKDIIKKLYEASGYGVKIDLIVRGICVLRPGIAGVSETIKVRSIIGRFLEHHRILYIANDDDEKVFLSSADWMPRNLNERVELLFPVEAEQHIERIKQILQLMLADNQKAHSMCSDGTYRRVAKRGKVVKSQEELCKLAKKAAELPQVPLEHRLKPLYRKE